VSRLNAPRTIPYEFRVFALDDVAWLFDESSRTYPCTATPHVYAEPLYWLDGECDELLPDAALFGASAVEALTTAPIDGLDQDGVSIETEESVAWDAAREEANANHRI
jgi:hypothetical protein